MDGLLQLPYHLRTEIALGKGVGTEILPDEHLHLHGANRVVASRPPCEPSGTNFLKSFANAQKQRLQSIYQSLTLS